MHGDSAYGLWTLVILNSAIFIFFAFSFAKPQTKTDWRSFGAFSAFIIALFTEMYGFPLTIYFLSGWLAEKYPGVDFLSHENGHLLHTMLGFEGDPHFDPLHIASNVLIVLGFFLLASAWNVLHKAQQTHSLATTGWYARCRHPQYIAFIMIMFGFLIHFFILGHGHCAHFLIVGFAYHRTVLQCGLTTIGMSNYVTGLSIFPFKR